MQGIKRGIMELADIVVVNKADGELKSKANLAAADVRQALRLVKPRYSQWTVPVLTASSMENEGVDTIWKHVCEFRVALDQSDGLDKIRRNQLKQWLWTETNELIIAQLQVDKKIKMSLDELQDQVMNGKITPSQAASTLLSKLSSDYKL